MNVADSLGRWAQETPFGVAIIDDTRVLHFRDLDTAVWRVASRFVAEGLRPGDRVGISLSGNSALYLIVVYALLRMGAVVMVMPLTEPAAGRLALARRLHLAAVIADDDAARLDALPLLKPGPDWLGPPDAPVDVGVRAAGGAAPCMIFLSSGTTGDPKAMERSHDDHARLFEVGRRQVVGSGGRFLTLTAFQFTYGLSHAMQTLHGGGSVRIVELPIAIDALCRVIDREHITHLAITPTFARDLLDFVAGDGPRFPGLRNIVLCTMAAPETLRREFRRRISPNLVIYYASNEAWYVTSADAAAQQAFPETVGFPHDGVEIEIVDDRDQALPDGEVGLVRLRAPGLPAGYIDDPEATVKAFRGGWYYPGDLGTLSPEGALFLKGRADDRINFDGIKIYPTDIETTLLQHPAVVEAAAFPVIIDYRQIPVAAVVLRSTVSSDDLIAFCQQQLGARAPRRIYVLSALPKTAIGKVLKRELTRRLSSSLSAAARIP